MASFKASFGLRRKVGVCDVHRKMKLANAEVPREVRFCDGCGAWICKECWFSWDRLVAGGISLGEAFLKLFRKAA